MRSRVRESVAEIERAAGRPKESRRQRSRGCSAFTLIELLVIIAIVAVLAAILLPALATAKVKARQVVCVNQIQQLTASLTMYITDHDAHMPWVRSNGNPSTCRTSPYAAERTGFGLISYAGYIGDPQLLFCPDTRVTDGWGSNPEGNRLKSMRNFDTYVENRQDTKVDYHLSWWGGGPSLMNWRKGKDYGRHLIGGGPAVYWIADGHGRFCYYYKSISHRDGLYMNLGNVDGGVDTVVDWKSKQPQTGSAGYYHPYNDRPGWGFWRWFGNGKNH